MDMCVTLEKPSGDDEKCIIQKASKARPMVHAGSVGRYKRLGGVPYGHQFDGYFLNSRDSRVHQDTPFAKMKLILLTCLVAYALADKLDHVYLPPSSASSSGGSEHILSAPYNYQPSHEHPVITANSAQRLVNAHTSQHGSSAHGSASPSIYGSSSSASSSILRSSSLSSSPTHHHASSHLQHEHNGVASKNEQQQIKIVRFENENKGNGVYSYGYETENQIKAQETGEIKNAGTQNEINSVRGSYSYEGPDGKIYAVEYIADENGFQVLGAHLPTPPPIPEAIAKALEYNAAHPEEEESLSSSSSSSSYPYPSSNQEGSSNVRSGSVSEHHQHTSHNDHLGVYPPQIVANSNVRAQSSNVNNQYIPPSQSLVHARRGYRY